MILADAAAVFVTAKLAAVLTAVTALAQLVALPVPVVEQLAPGTGGDEAPVESIDA